MRQIASFTVTQQDGQRIVIDVRDGDVSEAVPIKIAGFRRAGPIADWICRLCVIGETAGPIREVRVDAQVGRILVDQRYIEPTIVVQVGGDTTIWPAGTSGS